MVVSNLDANNIANVCHITNGVQISKEEISLLTQQDRSPMLCTMYITIYAIHQGTERNSKNPKLKVNP